MNTKSRKSDAQKTGYVLDQQIGFLLRKAHQRHRAVFSKLIGESIAPTQFAALVSLHLDGPTSQNLLGRKTAMDSATITGVITRLLRRKLVTRNSAPEDDRLSIIKLTEAGRLLISKLIPHALEITKATVEPLTTSETKTLIALLEKIS